MLAYIRHSECGSKYRRREPRWISARFFRIGSKASAFALPVHTSGSRSYGPCRLTIPCQVAAILSGVSSFIRFVQIFSGGLWRFRAREITADVWIDNWFSVYVNDDIIMEAPASMSTERSSNADTGIFSVAQAAIRVIKAKDFKENESGLEYIGSNRQQAGDTVLIVVNSAYLHAAPMRLLTSLPWQRHRE